MFWSDSKHRVMVYHVNGIIVGRGHDVSWGEEHPFGWKKISYVCEFLTDCFKKEGWFEEGSRTSVTTVKEKWGGIRVYAFIHPDDAEKVVAIYAEAIKKFPGAQDYLNGMCDGIPSTIVFKGCSREECKKYVETHQDLSDKEILK